MTPIFFTREHFLYTIIHQEEAIVASVLNTSAGITPRPPFHKGKVTSTASAGLPFNRPASDLYTREEVITAASACLPNSRAASVLSTGPSQASTPTRELCFGQNSQCFLEELSVGPGSPAAEPSTSTPTFS